MDVDARRRADLREFLMSRRARVSPAEAGLPDGGARRRTPGLRREEVAVLAGVGVSWYQWLEQGRDITVSGHVLDSVSRVLRLDEPERRHLYVLAGQNPPLAAAPAGATPVAESIQRLIDAWMPLPANVIDRYWNIIAANDVAVSVFDYTESWQNCLVSFFTNPIYRARHVGWEQDAADVAAEFRASAAEFTGDEGFVQIVEELAGKSDEFAGLWARGDVRVAGTRTKLVDHPLVGDLNFESTQLRVPERPDLTVVLHNAVAGTDTMRKLEWLASPEGRRSAMRPLAG